MILAAALYLFAGLLFAEASVMHLHNKPWGHVDRLLYVMLISAWPVVMPWMLWRATKLNKGKK